MLLIRGEGVKRKAKDIPAGASLTSPDVPKSGETSDPAEEEPIYDVD